MSGNKALPTPSCSAWAGRAWVRKFWQRPLAARMEAHSFACSIPRTRHRSALSKANATRPGLCSSCRANQAARSSPTCSRNTSSIASNPRSGPMPRARTSWRSPIPARSLEKEAKRDRFRHIFYGKPSIGGRYSVLSDFGLVPAAVMGLDLQRLLDTTALMVRSCGRHVPPAENPGVVLGAILGNAAKAGRDKVTIIASKGIADFGAWLEQLLAESTGKHGKGLVPVDAEPLGDAGVYGKDRVFAYLRLASKPDAARMTPSAPSRRPGIRWCASR